MEISSALDLKALQQQFDRDGYLALEGFFSSERIDGLRAVIARLLQERPHEVVVDNLLTGKRTYWAHATHRETRLFKFNDLYLLSPEVRELVLDTDLSALLASLLREPPVLCNSLTFEKGSGQPKHIDSLYMTPQTPHALVATWTALEDAHPDSGPLLYYPGSHKIPLYKFRDGTHHANNEEMMAWNQYIESQIKERAIPERLFFAKKGDVFIWHSDLLHAGSPIKDPNRTRNSLVCHYYGEADCRRMGNNLVPLHSGFWDKRPPHAVPAEKDRYSKDQPFPEEAYLTRYPDVREAVAKGQFASGKEHYLAFGEREGRAV